MGVPTLYNNGVTNAEPNTMMANFVAPDPTKVISYFEDFFGYTAAQWTVTETQAGATQAIVAGDGGILALVNSAANNDLNAIQWLNEIFRMATNKAIWMQTRFKASDAVETDVAIGLQITNTTPFTSVTDGMFFRKSDDGSTLNFVMVKDSAELVIPVGAIVSDTYVEAAAYYDPTANAVSVFLNGNRTGTVAVTTATFCNDEDLAPVYAVMNGDGNARTLSVDYLFVAKAR